MELPALWFIKEDPDIYYELGEALVQDASLGLLNTRELLDAEYALRDTTGDPDGPWPAAYPAPVAALPDWPFAPDFWTFGCYEFASRRLREALAQSGEVVQALPFDLVRASAAAWAQDYRWMRVLACQEGLDLARCDCRIEERPHAVTGRPVRFLSNIDFFALRENLVPRTGIFRLEESPTYILVTDAVAGRVLRAGCTGMESSDPANRQSGKRVDRIRTADGIAERRIGFLD
jgi:hypothetical protein